MIIGIATWFCSCKKPENKQTVPGYNIRQVMDDQENKPVIIVKTTKVDLEPLPMSSVLVVKGTDSALGYTNVAGICRLVMPVNFTGQCSLRVEQPGYTVQESLFQSPATDTFNCIME